MSTTTKIRSRLDAGRSQQRVRRAHFTRIVACVAVVIIALAAGVALARRATFDPAPGTPVTYPPASQRPASAAAPPPGPSASAAPSPSPAGVTFPKAGAGTYAVVPGQSPIVGRSGTLMRYQIAIETGIENLDAAAVAATVEATYADPRGWTAGNQWRFQRVGPDQQHEFVLYLATPATRDKLCGDSHDLYTSCRNQEKVVLNISRWVNAVPNYGATTEAYRQYAINHETGHRLGLDHERCPADGKPAPVMQQQTLGLHGCVANAWPYLDGKRYSGQAGAYDDPIPTE